MENVLSNIASFSGNPQVMRGVSTGWNQRVKENDKAIMDGLERKYPGLNIRDLLYLAFSGVLPSAESDRIKRDLLIEYSGKIPDINFLSKIIDNKKDAELVLPFLTGSSAIDLKREVGINVPLSDEDLMDIIGANTTDKDLFVREANKMIGNISNTDLWDDLLSITDPASVLWIIDNLARSGDLTALKNYLDAKEGLIDESNEYEDIIAEILFDLPLPALRVLYDEGVFAGYLIPIFEKEGVYRFQDVPRWDQIIIPAARMGNVKLYDTARYNSSVDTHTIYKALTGPLIDHEKGEILKIFKNDIFILRDFPEHLPSLHLVTSVLRDSKDSQLKAYAIAICLNSTVYDIVPDVFLNKDNILRVVAIKYPNMKLNNHLANILKLRGIYSVVSTPIRDMPKDLWSKLLANAIVEGNGVLITDILSSHGNEITPQMKENMRQLVTKYNPIIMSSLKL